MRRNTLPALALAVAMVGLAGCADADQPSSPEPTNDATPDSLDIAELERLAKEEGQVDWLAAGTEAASTIVAEAFEEQYGIEVNWTRYTSADMAQRVQSDTRSHGRVLADVTTQTDNGLALHLRDEGWIEPVSAEQFPDFPADLMFEDVGPIVQLAIPVIGYNVDLLDGFTPASWQDLLDPRLQGEIMITDPRTAATWGQIWYAILNEPSLGESFVEELGATGYQPVASSLVGAEQLTAGQGAVLLASLPSVFDAQVANGANIEYFSPTDPAPAAYTSVSLISEAEHPNAAYLFALWLTSEEGSRIMNAAEGSASPLGIEGEGVVPLPPGVNTVPPAPDAVREAGEEAARLLGMN